MSGREDIERRKEGVRSTRQACRWLGSQEKENERGWEGLVQGRGMGVESQPDARKKEKHRVHEDGECGMMPQPHENRVLKGPTQTASVGLVAK